MVEDIGKDASRMQYRTRHVFVAIVLIGVFLLFRQWGVARKNEGIVILGVPFVSIASSLYAAMHCARYRLIFVIAAFSSFLCLTSWAIERVYESPGTYFLRTPPSLSAGLTTHPELNMLMVAILTIANTLIGGLIGSLSKYLRSWNSF